MQRVFAAALAASLLVAGAAWATDAQKPPAKSPELVEKGKTLYGTTCAVCHGEKGDGTGPAAAGLNPKPRDFGKDELKQGGQPHQVFKTITEGVKDTPMVGWAQLSLEDRWALTYYVLELMPKKAKKK